MKEVYQTIFGAPEGNCLAACVASIMNLPLEEVPNFVVPEPLKWRERLDDWLSEQGLGVVCIIGEALPNAYSIACGPSPHGPYDHCVVWLNGDMVHDPHPSGDGILATADWTYFVKLNPCL